MDETAPFEFRQCVSIHKSSGKKGGEYMHKNFLITRQIRDYLSVRHSIENKGMGVFAV